jgi:hypothetical protein
MGGPPTASRALVVQNRCMKVIASFLLALAALAAATAVSAGQIYKQTDAQGRVIFTDVPDPSARTVATYETTGETQRPSGATSAPVLLPTSGVPAASIGAPMGPTLAPWQEARLAVSRGERMNSLRSREIDAREAARAGR